jgi:hypothetical protein
MKKRNCNPALTNDVDDHDDRFDLTVLLHPAGAFAHPSDVVKDCDLTLSEKRAILAAWASDACAVEANPALRRASRSTRVPFDAIMDALRALDRQAAERRKPLPHYRRVLDRRGLTSPERNFCPGGDRGGESGDQGSRLH